MVVQIRADLWRKRVLVFDEKTEQDWDKWRERRHSVKRVEIEVNKNNNKQNEWRCVKESDLAWLTDIGLS